MIRVLNKLNNTELLLIPVIYVSRINIMLSIDLIKLYRHSFMCLHLTLICVCLLYRAMKKLTWAYKCHPSWIGIIHSQPNFKSLSLIIQQHLYVMPMEKLRFYQDCGQMILKVRKTMVITFSFLLHCLTTTKEQLICQSSVLDSRPIQ